MIRTIIIEDEIGGQEVLKKNLIEHFPQCGIEAIADHVDSAIEKISALQPDLVLVDIHIKGGTGFDILNHFKVRDFEVIFITAYDQYAIQAIKEGALDYILKPVNSAEFQKGVSKAVDRIHKKAITHLNIPTQSGIEIVNREHIVFLEAEGSHTSIHLVDSEIASTKTIGEYEALLSASPFFRTHHSFIVNTAHIKRFNKGRSGLLMMTTGHMIPVSQRRMKEFGELIKANEHFSDTRAV